MTSTIEHGAASAVGVGRARIEAAAKVTGSAVYAADVPISGLLHGRLVLSEEAHARIVSIDREAALAQPGVEAVLLHGDLPIKAGFGRAAEPLAREEVVFAGQPVALVLADSEAHAEDAVELVHVEYEPLEAVMDPWRAIQPGSPLARATGQAEEADVEMHGSATGGEHLPDDRSYSANVVDHKLFSRGAVDEALARSAAVVEGRFRVPWLHQAYMEPQVATAWPEEPGGLAVLSSTQAIFWVRQELSRLFQIPLSKVRVQAGTLGGGFGGKLRLIEPLVASAALAVGRPVRVAFTRSEDFAAANPCPSLEFDLRIGADADGRFTAIAAQILIDCGAFTDSAPAALAGSRLAGPYHFDRWRVETIGVRTNRFGGGAYRGPTVAQATFAVESLVDELAERLGIDPIELRLRNAPEPGMPRLDGVPWPKIGFRETLESLGAHPLWQRRDQLPDNEGVGLAIGMFPGAKQGAGAICRMDSDGGLTVISGYVDMTGTDTAIAAIAAEVFGVSPDRVRVSMDDTSSAPHAGVSGGSMVTYCLGGAVAAAAREARRQTLEVAAQELEIDEADLEIKEGEVRPLGSPHRGISLAEIGAKVTGFGPYAPIEGHGRIVPPELAPSVAGALAHVRVDPDTGAVNVLCYVAAQDCGRAINPALVQGQMRGGAAQAIGMALYEDLAHDEHGELIAGSFLSYAIPRSSSLPAIEAIIVEVPSPHGPLGARGVGESAMAPGAGAVANAIAAAVGRRFRSLPITSARVWEALVDVRRDR
jgi:CO/xanthine dehydrogenase Mo-binding subunit